MSRDEALRRAILEMRTLEAIADSLNARISVASAALNELNTAKTTIEGIKSQQPGIEVLLPIGGGAFVRARLEDTSTIALGVGGGVVIEKNINEAGDDLGQRMAELERAISSLQQQLEQVLRQIEEKRGEIERLARAAQKGQ